MTAPLRSQEASERAEPSAFLEEFVEIHRGLWRATPLPSLADVSELDFAELGRAHRAATMSLFREQGAADDPLDPVDASGAVADLCRVTTARMLEQDSPWRPHDATIVQSSGNVIEGPLVNASVTRFVSSR